MTKLGGPFVSYERGRQILGDTDTVFVHSAEIIRRARMAALGGVQMVFHCLQSFVSPGKALYRAGT
jgi:hypothetical protein